MSSCDHAGCRTALRGRNSAITGLMSSTGVPSIASSSCTISARPFDAHQRAQIVVPETIRAVLAALSEDADRRPLRIVARMARAGDDLRRVDLVEVEQHFDVRELAQARQRVRRELRHELDARLLAAPEIVLGMRPWRLHVTDRLELDSHGSRAQCNGAIASAHARD